LSSTQAQTEVMTQTAKRFEQVDHNLQDMLRTLMSRLEPLQSRWQGRGGMSFDQTKQAWAGDLKAMHEALSQTAEAIRNAGRGYAATDSDSDARMSRTRGNLNLPL
jgi:WXG100 family type VII secretion target